MHVFRYVLSIFLLILGFKVFGNDLEKCLSNVNNEVHRLDRESAVSSCFTKHTAAMTKPNCYTTIEKFKPLISSSRLYKQAVGNCFYEAASFAKMSDCMKDTDKFRNAAEHDEAVFFCYQTFQDKIDKNACIKTAKRMIFPPKRDYLLNHCIQN
jgi:hypothetical protein